VRGLYPCGEGSGYAGGIVSSGIDGLRISEEVVLKTARMPKVDSPIEH